MSNAFHWPAEIAKRHGAMDNTLLPRCSNKQFGII
jgi:hypothetical protein